MKVSIPSLTQPLSDAVEQALTIPLTTEVKRQLNSLEPNLKNNSLTAEELKWIQQSQLTPQQLSQFIKPTSSADLSECTIQYYNCNHLGTPQMLVDLHGNVVWQADYDPWGNRINEKNPSNLYQPIRMQGQHYDEESGLHYNRYRYYDPNSGRYITQDPIGLKGGMNIYQYANNNALLFTDPMGLECICSNIVMKRKDAHYFNAILNNVGLGNQSLDNYGHWWTEIDGVESYGWWPKNPVSGIGETMRGVDGELNGQTDFGGTPTQDPHHNDKDPNITVFNPKIDTPWYKTITDKLGITTKTTKTCDEQCKDAADCFRNFANTYSGDWAWRPGDFGQNCHSFQKEGMKKCNLKK